jgi:hypothetical protein
MEKTTALYAYFGELGIFNTNIPGHTFYQVGLMDAIANRHGIEKFDFYNYVNPHGVDVGSMPTFPKDGLGEVFNSHASRLLREYQIDLNRVIQLVSDKAYSKLFLKARFRNLSTLEKRLVDVRTFEQIIHLALKVGYDPKDIVILDTDLSLSEPFMTVCKNLGITIETPSITYPAIGPDFLADCMHYHNQNPIRRGTHMVYYGNLDFSNYKTGHSKNPIVFDLIDRVPHMTMFNGESFSLDVIVKESKDLIDRLGELVINGQVGVIYRNSRERIWESLSKSAISINVSKDLYIERGFTPARVYESLIFGSIPVSYKMSYHPALSFDNVEHFEEISKYIAECSTTDYLSLYNKLAVSMSTWSDK